MKRAVLSARDRALLDEVRELVRALGAHLSLEIEDRLARLEQLVRERRTVVIRGPIKVVRGPINGARLVARALPPSSPAGPALDPEPGPPSPQGRGAPHRNGGDRWT